MKLESSSSLVQVFSSPHLSQILLLFFSLSCCGSLVGLSRLLPRLASQTFHTTSQSLILYFVAIFGLSKASFNLIAAQLSSSYNRSHILCIGWLISLISPFIILHATSWSQVLFSTAFFGAAQGILTSTTVIMLMDRVTNRQRGVVNGVLECLLYCSLAAFTLVSGWIEERYGYRPYICYVSVAVSLIGLLSAFVITDTRALVKAEEVKTEGGEGESLLPPSLPTSSSSSPVQLPQSSSITIPDTSSSADSSELSILSALSRCFRRPHLLALTFAGFANNFDDGLIWGSLPAFFAEQSIPLHLITVLLTAYPLVWGILQAFTGMAADKYGRKEMIVGGITCQSISFLLMHITARYANIITPLDNMTATSLPFVCHLLASVMLGVGTALCYPVLQASLSDSVPPKQRASMLGVYRLCRDSGYVAGGLVSGVIADYLSLNSAVLGLSGLLMCAAVYGQLRLEKDGRDVRKK